MKIVLADSDHDGRSGVSSILRNLGHEVLETDGDENIGELIQQHKPDVIVLDPYMPAVDGLRTLEQIARCYPELPLLAVSGIGRISGAMETIRKGAWDFIAKPIDDQSELVRAMEIALEKRELRRGIREYRFELEKQAQESMAAWRSAHEALERKTVALEEVLSVIEREKRAGHQRIMQQMEMAAMPILERAIKESPTPVRAMLKQLRTNLEAITSPYLESLARRFASLTRTEVRICQMVRRGMSSKDIAQAEGTATETIHAHRKRIRRKLKIAKAEVNLAAFLQSLEEEEASSNQGLRQTHARTDREISTL